MTLRLRLFAPDLALVHVADAPLLERRPELVTFQARHFRHAGAVEEQTDGTLAYDYFEEVTYQL